MKPIHQTATAAVLASLIAASGALAVPGTAHAETVRGLEYWYDALHLAQAQKISQGQSVVVAVIDTGVDATHPDMTGQVLPGAGVASDAPADGRQDNQGHGTAMASIIAAKGGNQSHLLGVAPQAEILPVSTGVKTVLTGDVANGIRWAADHGAKVINISEGIDSRPADEVLVNAVKYAFSKDVVVVVSAGNTNKVPSGKVIEPANIPGVIAVGGIGKDGSFYPGAVTGPEISIAAPAEQIISAAPTIASPNGYVIGDGTSGAAAMVSGVAALIRAKYPNLKAGGVVNRLIKTAHDIGAPGRDPQTGFGELDAEAALTDAVPDVTDNPLLAEADTPGTSAAAHQPPGKTTGPAVAIRIHQLSTSAWVSILLCALAVLAGVGVTVRAIGGRRRSRHRAFADARMHSTSPTSASHLRTPQALNRDHDELDEMP